MEENRLSNTIRLSRDHYERLRTITHKLRISKQAAMTEAMEMWLKMKEGETDVKTP